MSKVQMVEVSRARLEELEKDSNHLRMLINRGVDNWDGYVGPNHDDDECPHCGLDEDDCECGGGV